MNKQENDKKDIKIIKELYNFMYKKGYIELTTSKISPYRTKAKNTFVNFSLDMFRLLKEGNILELQALSKEVIEDCAKTKK